MDQSSRASASPATLSSSSLLVRIRSHDDEAWSRFSSLYTPVIYGLCRVAKIQPADAEDISQEVLNSVAKKIDDFRKEKSSDSFRGWLYFIVRNKIHDHFRRIQRRPNAMGGSSFNEVVHQVSAPLDESSFLMDTDSETDPALMRALEMIRSEFEDRTWQAFWRMVVNGERAVDVAEDLGMKPNSVRQAKFRIMQRLRSEFGDLIDLPE